MTTWLIIIISALGLWIGYLQFLLAKQRSKLDLYDKRYPVFAATMEYLAYIAREGTINQQELIKFLRNSKDVDFFFGQDIQQFLSELYNKGVDLAKYDHKIKGRVLPDDEHGKLVDMESELLEWFLKQFEVSKELFKKYLAIDKKQVYPKNDLIDIKLHTSQLKGYDMKKIWITEFYCDKCKQSLKGAVYSDNITELPEEEKEKAKEYLLHFHIMDNHLSCWKCKKHIKADEIEAVILVGEEMKDLCKDCSKQINWFKNVL